MSDNWAWTTDATLPSCRGAHLPLMEEILDQLSQHGWEGRDFFGVQMALEESLTNAIRHGNKLDERKCVDVSCKVSPDVFWLRVKDEGEGFDPDDVADCTSQEGVECTGGRGMLLIKTFMTDVTHNAQGNCVTMKKVRSADEHEDKGNGHPAHGGPGPAV